MTSDEINKATKRKPSSYYVDLASYILNHFSKSAYDGACLALMLEDADNKFIEKIANTCLNIENSEILPEKVSERIQLAEKLKALKTKR